MPSQPVVQLGTPHQNLPANTHRRQCVHRRMNPATDGPLGNGGIARDLPQAQPFRSDPVSIILLMFHSSSASLPMLYVRNPGAYPLYDSERNLPCPRFPLFFPLAHWCSPSRVRLRPATPALDAPHRAGPAGFIEGVYRTDSPVALFPILILCFSRPCLHSIQSAPFAHSSWLASPRPRQCRSHRRLRNLLSFHFCCPRDNHISVRDF